MLFQLISYVTGGERRQKAKALASGGDPDGDAETLDVLAALEKFPGIRPDPEAFIEALDPLQPRLYSIASSFKTDPGRVALTVDAVRYAIKGRGRLGVASTYLAERAKPGDEVRVYVQKASGFGLPADPSVPVIMIGPGTGIAPFRAFLHERMATKAKGRNWLFFGHQHRECDFFYEDELSGMKPSAWPRTWSSRWSISSPSTARARSTRRSPSSPTSRRKAATSRTSTRYSLGRTILSEKSANFSGSCFVSFSGHWSIAVPVLWIVSSGRVRLGQARKSSAYLEGCPLVHGPHAQDHHRR
jgi:hypothetical protein